MAQSIHVLINLITHAHTHARTHMHAHTYTHTHARSHARARTHARAHTHTDSHVACNNVVYRNTELLLELVTLWRIFCINVQRKLLKLPRLSFTYVENKHCQLCSTDVDYFISFIKTCSTQNKRCMPMCFYCTWYFCSWPWSRCESIASITTGYNCVRLLENRSYVPWSTRSQRLNGHQTGNERQYVSASLYHSHAGVSNRACILTTLQNHSTCKQKSS